MTYNWQLFDWPKFRYDVKVVEDLLFEYAQREGRTSGLFKGLAEDVKSEVIIDMMVSEAIKTSEIEGEYLSRRDVLSSIKKNLGVQNIPQVSDLRVQGIAALMADVRGSFLTPLTEGTLFSWHKMVLMGSKGINVGQWRSHTAPMQVVSGSIGREKIHFEAPPSKGVAREMKNFITWFNKTMPQSQSDENKAPIRSAIAHLYFESIHPFEDGNGRIGRAISEKALSQGLGHPVLLSLSKTIEGNKKEYYQHLKDAQKTNEITTWVNYFVSEIVEAQRAAEKQIAFTLKKAQFFDQFKKEFNKRQEKVIGKMLEVGENGFEGGMSAKKYMSICKTSKATATRDLQNLTDKGAFLLTGSGRSTRYQVNFFLG